MGKTPKISFLGLSLLPNPTEMLAMQDTIYFIIVATTLLSYLSYSDPMIKPPTLCKGSSKTSPHPFDYMIVQSQNSDSHVCYTCIIIS